MLPLLLLSNHSMPAKKVQLCLRYAQNNHHFGSRQYQFLHYPSMWPKGPYQAPIQEASILGGGGLKKPQWGKNRPLAYATNVSSCGA